MKILVTGAAGFIGSKLAFELIKEGHDIVGIDSINDYYNPNLKYARLRHFFNIETDESWSRSASKPKTGTSDLMVEYPEMPWGKEICGNPVNVKFRFFRLDITDIEALRQLFVQENFDKVVNLAAQAGVRYSIENPLTYVKTNVLGFANILECCRQYGVSHLIYASSSSVYGGNRKTPFEESDRVDTPVSLYAATKKSDELLASVYSKIYGLNVTGLRFFTVYGPWGRPDMAPMLFANAILADKPINVFNNGNLSRDFTFIDDIVEGIIKVIDDEDVTANEVYNIGHGAPVKLMDFINTIESKIGKCAKMNMLPMQMGDVCITYADTRKLKEKYGFHPSTSLSNGIETFINWFKTYNSDL